MAKLIIIGGVAIGAAALIAGITVPIVVSNQGSGSTENPSTPNLPTDAQKINELKEKFTKGLDEANKKITDSAKFVETYESLKKELGKSNTINGITYVLSEVKVTDETNISANKEIAIKYDFTLATTKDSLTYSFKNPKVVDPNPEPEKPNPDPEKPNPEPEKPNPDPEKPNPEPEKPSQDKTDWQKVRAVKEDLLLKIKQAYWWTSFESQYNQYQKELNQIQTGEYGTNIKLFYFKAEFPKAERIVNNSWLDIKYEISYNGYSEILSYRVQNKEQVKNIKMVNDLTSLKDGFVVRDGVIFMDLRLNSPTAKLDDLVIPEFVDSEVNKETGVILRAEVIGVWDDVYKGRQIRTLKLPRTIKYIGRNAFSDNQIIAVDSKSTALERIEEGAFRNNKISYVTFPKTLYKIGEEAFFKNQIPKVDLSETKVTVIERSAFEENRISSVQFNLDTTLVCKNAFFKNELTIVALNNSNFSQTKIQEIEWFAFGYQKYDYRFNLQNSTNEEIKDPSGVLKLPYDLKLIHRGAFHIFQKISWKVDINSIMHSQMFVYNGDYLEYPKKIIVVDEEGARYDYTNATVRDGAFVYRFAGRAFFNAAVTNYFHWKDIKWDKWEA